jgi:hypothetical protein
MPSTPTGRRTAPVQPLPPQPTAAIALRALLPEPESDTVVQGPSRPETPPTTGQLVELERPASRGATNPRFISMEALVQQHQRHAQEAETRAQQLEAAFEEATLAQNRRYSTQPPPTMLATVASYPLAAVWGFGSALRATPGTILNAPWTLASTAHGAVSSVANSYGRAMVWWSRPTTPETPINFRTVEERPSYQHTKRFPRSAGTGNRERGLVLHASKDEIFYIPNMVRDTGTQISFTSRYDRDTLSLVYTPDGLGSISTLNNHRTLQLFDAQCLSTVNDLIAQLTDAQISDRSVFYPARAAAWNTFVTGSMTVGEAVLTVTQKLGIYDPRIVGVILGAALGVVGANSAVKAVAVAFREGWHLSKRRKVEAITKQLLEDIWSPFLAGRPDATSEFTRDELRSFKDARPKDFNESKRLQMHLVVHETLTVAIQRIREREGSSGVPFAQWRRQGREQGQAVTSSLAGPSFARRRNVQQITEGNQQ